MCVLRAVLHHRAHNEHLLFSPLPHFMVKVKSHTDTLHVSPLTPVPNVPWPHILSPGWEAPGRCRWKFFRHRWKSSRRWGTKPALVTLYSLLEHSLKNTLMSGLGHLMLQPAPALLPSSWSNLVSQGSTPSSFLLQMGCTQTLYSIQFLQNYFPPLS